MFDPSRIAAFRVALQQNPALKQFDGRPCRVERAETSTDPATLWSEPASSYASKPPDVIFGQPVDNVCLDGLSRRRLTLPARRIVRAADAAIIGPSAVLGADGGFFAPETVVIADRGALPAHHGVAFIDDGQVGFFGQPCGRRLPMAGLFFPNLEPANYGSFLFRQLPALIACRAIAESVDCYITPERSGCFREALALLGYPKKPVYRVAEVIGDRFDTLAWPMGFDQEGVLGASSWAAIQAMAESLAEAALDGTALWKKSPEKLFISRQLQAVERPWYRPLTNEAALQAMAVEAGYTVCMPELWTLAEQISLFRGARQIVGASGSGMLNAIFAPAGCRVLDIESYHVTVRQHANLYASSGKDYAFAFGVFDEPEPVDRITAAWSLDPALLAQGLIWLDAKR